MTFHSNWMRFISVATFIILFSASSQLTSAQTAGNKTQPGSSKVKPSAPTDTEEARLKQFLDKDGGYKDNEGGYYNPKKGTYTDAEGGIVDNWEGYTYKDGSYKASTGDYWNAPKKTFELASGETLKSEETTSAEAITTLREAAKEQGHYNEDGIRSAMMARIRMEHPPTPAKGGKRP